MTAPVNLACFTNEVKNDWCLMDDIDDGATVNQRASGRLMLSGYSSFG